MRLTPFCLTQNISVDNALSTIQVIHQIITKVNNVVDYVNNLEIDSNKYTDEQIKLLNEKIESELLELETTLKSYSDTLISDMKKYVDNADKSNRDLLMTSLVTIREEMEKLEQKLKLYIDTEDSKIYVYIDEIYKELYDIIKNGNSIIYSPVDGFLKSVKDTIQDLTHIVQLKNGISWNVLETMCEGGMGDLTDYTKPNPEFNIYVNISYGADRARIDYLDPNGLHIVCNSAIQHMFVNGELFDNFEGAGVLIPLATLNNVFLTTILITDTTNLSIEVYVKNGNKAIKPVTWNSLEQRLNAHKRYNNWNSLTFYTVAFANDNLMRTDGTIVDVLKENMYTTEYNKEFFGGK